METASPKLVPLDPEAEAALSLALAASVRRCGVPTLSDVAHDLAHLDDVACQDEGFNPTRIREHAEPVHASLMALVRGELAGLFDGPSTIRFDPTLPMIGIGSAALGEDDRLQSLVMTCSLGVGRRAPMGRPSTASGWSCMTSRTASSGYRRNCAG